MVSVIIPVYNRGNIIAAAVNSVLNQTYTDLELIIVDDGSTDNTKDALSQISDERLRYIYQDNAGACVARNHGIELARGEYIAFHDSDDIWHLDKLEKQMAVFDEYNPDIVFCKLRKRHSNGEITLEPFYLKEGIVNPVRNLFGIGTQTIIAKKQVFEKYKFDSDLPRFQEYEFLLRASKDCSMYCLNDGLVDYEVGTDSISANPKKLYKACELILKKHPELKNYPIMMDYMAHSLLTGANQLKEKKDSSYLVLLKLALKISDSYKIKIKAMLVRANIYTLSRNLRKKS